MLTGQPLHPLKHALQIFTDASKEGWGTHLDGHTARGTWSLPRKQVAHKPSRVKSCISSSKRVSDPLLQQDSTDSYRQHNSGCLYQQRGGMKSGSLCALLWIILSWCTRQQVTLRARHIPGRLNVIAHKLSRLGQTIQTEWSTSPRSVPSYMLPVAPAPIGLVCHQIQQQTSTVCVTDSRPPGLGSGRTQPFLGGLDPYAFPPAAILGKVVEKLQDYPCNRIILIAPGWLNMPWFWDLVAMSSQIPRVYPTYPICCLNHSTKFFTGTC